jgi:hypothetical protein
MADVINNDELNLEGLDEMIHQAIKELIAKKIKDGLIDVDMLKNGSIQDTENELPSEEKK